MEYFLPLSVMAMIISSISLYLIDYKKPAKPTGPENDPSSSDANESSDTSAAKFVVSEQQENPQTDTSSNNYLEDKTQKEFHSTRASLKAFQQSFSILWNTTRRFTFYNTPNG
ncbi:MAG: hypothetical protein AAF960_29545 [Bacteroidota bacterium]